MIQVDIEVQVFVKILCVECGEIAQWEKELTIAFQKICFDP